MCSHREMVREIRREGELTGWTCQCGTRFLGVVEEPKIIGDRPTRKLKGLGVKIADMMPRHVRGVGKVMGESGARENG